MSKMQTAGKSDKDIKAATEQSDFEQALLALRKKKEELSCAFETLKSKGAISMEDDESLNMLVDHCYSSLSEATVLVNRIFETDKEAFLESYTVLTQERNEISSIKDSVNLYVSHKWREEIVRQIELNNAVKEEVRSFSDKNEELARTVQALKEEGESTLEKAISSQKAVEESSNRYIAIAALLVSLLAIIFANISEFLSTATTWQSVVILNSSVLLAACVIFAIIENGHLFTLKILGTRADCRKIFKHQIVFNVFIGSLVILIAGVLIFAIWAINH